MVIIRPCASEMLDFFRGWPFPLTEAEASSSDWKSLMLFGRDDLSSQWSSSERVSKDWREKCVERGKRECLRWAGGSMLARARQGKTIQSRAERCDRCSIEGAILMVVKVAGGCDTINRSKSQSMTSPVWTEARVSTTSSGTQAVAATPARAPQSIERIVRERIVGPISIDSTPSTRHNDGAMSCSVCFISACSAYRYIMNCRCVGATRPSCGAEAINGSVRG